MAVLRLHSSSFHFQLSLAGSYLALVQVLAQSLVMHVYRWLCMFIAQDPRKMRKDQAKLVFYKDLRSLLFFLSFISNLRFEERRSLEFNQISKKSERMFHSREEIFDFVLKEIRIFDSLVNKVQSHLALLYFLR